MNLLENKILTNEPKIINNCFISKFIAQYARKYQEITSILPDQALYRSAARIYKSSGLSIFLNSDPDFCSSMATLKTKNPHMNRFKFANGYEHFRQSDVVNLNEESYNYSRAMQEKGFCKGISILNGNNIYTEGLGLLGDDFFREKQVQDKFENELKYVMKEITKIFNCIEYEYKLSRMYLLDCENNRKIKFTKYYERKKSYLIKYEL